ncbi:serine/threonine-protein kinase [Sandaracinus amylolyticus]|uniref:serine/threonine-protein kinase n=1 Tax=Sandaracinus amylolyticus TaxID=927083 RepID=UPI00146FDD79|nr:serine/threonine-protein kinase [Sandaracinus amylolyticus]
MPRKSAVRMILDQLSLVELRTFADYYDLPTSGTKAKLASRIAARVQRDLSELVSAQGPWGTSDWNSLIEELGGSRRKSWDEVREELAQCVRFDRTRLRRRMEAIGDYSVADVREDRSLLARYAEILLVEADDVLDAIEGMHGNTLISNVWDELVDDLGTHQRAENEDLDSSANHAAAPNGTSTAVPRALRTSGTTPNGSQTRATDPLVLKAGVLVARRYRITRELGRGGMATTFEVRDERSDAARLLVAKFPYPECVDILRREFAAGLEITHRNVCRYLHDEHDETFGAFVLMEHGGESLAKRYATRQALWRDALAIMRQAATGLDAMHEHERVHGDVSAGNILIDDRGRVRLADLGISATLVRHSAGETRHATSILGQSDHFSAPEVRTGRLVSASDQFSLARVLCAILHGVDAWIRSPGYADMLSSSQRDAVYRALHTDPRQRFPACGAFIDALEAGR